MTIDQFISQGGKFVIKELQNQLCVEAVAPYGKSQTFSGYSWADCRNKQKEFVAPNYEQLFQKAVDDYHLRKITNQHMDQTLYKFTDEEVETPFHI